MKKIYLIILILFATTISSENLFAQRSRILVLTSSSTTWTTSSSPFKLQGTSTSATPTANDSLIISSTQTLTVDLSTGGSNTVTVSGATGIGMNVSGAVILNNSSSSKTESLQLPAGSKIFVGSGASISFSKSGTSGSSDGTGDVLKIGSVTAVSATSIYPINNAANTAGTVRGSQVTVSGAFTASNAAGTPLPVTFGAIKASEKGTGVQIDWTSYSEQNLANYQIERSADGIHFTSVGEVAPRNISAETQYGFFDALPLSGTSFYRIRNNDIDGKSGLSNIVKINLNKNIKTIGIYPNPILGNRVSFQSSDLAKGMYQVEVINAVGTRVFQQSVSHAGGAINQSLNLPTMQSGQYTLRINGTSSSSTHKITILQ